MTAVNKVPSLHSYVLVLILSSFWTLHFTLSVNTRGTNPSSTISWILKSPSNLSMLSAMISISLVSHSDDSWGSHHCKRLVGLAYNLLSNRFIISEHRFMLKARSGFQFFLLLSAILSSTLFVSQDGDTALHLACARVHPLIVRFLLVNGANPNSLNKVRLILSSR